jgi:hypothetical protein
MTDDNERAARLLTVTEPTLRVLDDIAAERERQWAKWGDQSDIADADPMILARLGERYGGTHVGPSAVAVRLAQEYEVPTEARAKFICQTEAARHGGTYFGICMEEVAEVLDAVAHAHAADDPSILRAEVIQAAACFTQWAEAIDRRGLKATPQRGA